MLAFSMSRLSVKWLEGLASPLAFGVEALAIHNTGSNRACQSYSEIFMHKYTGKIEIVQNSYVVTPKLQKKKSDVSLVEALSIIHWVISNGPAKFWALRNWWIIFQKLMESSDVSPWKTVCIVH